MNTQFEHNASTNEHTIPILIYIADDDISYINHAPYQFLT